MGHGLPRVWCPYDSYILAGINGTDQRQRHMDACIEVGMRVEYTEKMTVQKTTDVFP